MASMRWSLTLLAVAVGVIVSARLTLQAQDRGGKSETELKVVHPSRRAEDFKAARLRAEPRSVQDALQRPFAFPFREPVTLEDVCRHLRQVLDAPVVLDLAALNRLELTPTDRVQLELEGVRLKTGLQLLLDQVGMTYRVVPEDNLLVVTDGDGSDESLDRVLSELKSLHRDIHDVQDAIAGVRSALGLDEGGPKMRKPTIIEEVPAKPDGNPSAPPSATPPRVRPGT
jgi:hypothetical protein